jgi:hypothetical protein
MGRRLVRKFLLGGHRGCAGSSIRHSPRNAVWVDPVTHALVDPDEGVRARRKSLTKLANGPQFLSCRLPWEPRPSEGIK